MKKSPLHFLALALLLGLQAPLWAQRCECLEESPEEVEARAELILVGTVVHVEGVMDARQEVKATLRVERVLKGAWQTEQFELRTPGLPERCGLDFREHAQWVVCARKVRMGEWYSDQCDGSRLGSETANAQLDNLQAEYDRKTMGARYVMPGFEYFEDLVVRGSGVEAKLFKPNDALRQKGTPFRDATLYFGDFHHNGMPLKVSVVYRSTPLEAKEFEQWVPGVAGIPAEAAEMRLHKDDEEETEFLIKRRDSDGSTGAIVTYFKLESMVVVYFVE